MTVTTVEQGVPEAVLRIEKGSVDGHELAAIAVLLLGRAASGGSAPPEPATSAAGWRAPGFTGARSWKY